MKPKLLVTIGDPAGIGPEIVLKALASSHIHDRCDIVVVGSSAILSHTFQQLAKHCAAQGQPLANPDRLAVLEVPLPQRGAEPKVNLPQSSIIPGQASVLSGAASFAYLDRAIDEALSGLFDGIVTAPIAKAAWQAAGHSYPGQTEVLAQKAGIEKFGMLFVARSPHSNWVLRTLLATTHISLRQVPDTLTPQLLDHKLSLLLNCLQQDFGLTGPSIAIAGLNPHSGEQGHLGHEEQDWLIPWLERASQTYPQVQLHGPVPPDTLWVKPGQAWYDAHTQAHDAYLALYHDQGLIPLKLLAFDRAVNTSIGLPFVRTSPDHGTAFDIAGQGIARSESMQQAIELAIELVQNRHARQAQ